MVDTIGGWQYSIHGACGLDSIHRFIVSSHNWQPRHAISSCAVDHDTWICSICIPFVNRSYNVQVLSLAADVWCGTRILSIVWIMWFSMEHITCWLVLSSPKHLRQKKTWIINDHHLVGLEHAWTQTYVQPPEVTTGYKVSYPLVMSK